MSAPSLSTQAAKANGYPKQFNLREAQLLQSVKDYVDALAPSAPSHVVKFAGDHTTAGGDAAETIAVVGALDTDIVIVTVKTAGATPRSVVAAAADADEIDVTMSGDPSTDHVLSYVVLREA